ncbi:MAG: alpha/beta hydrolase [Herminiimonas sp.]|nr:alpha/beta hydrolase [Herminiimonas sp.]
MPTIDTNGITLTYETHGDHAAPSLLLIMGLGMQLISWPDELCDGLVRQGFHVIRFDNRDSGLSTKMEQFGKPNLTLTFVKSILALPITSGYSLGDMAKDTVGLLDGLGIAKAHLVGASMGGMIAQVVAASHPERVLTLTSIMSTSGRRGLPGPTAAARKAVLAKAANPRDLDSVTEHMVNTMRAIGSPAYPASDADLRQRVHASVRRNVTAAGIARQLVAVAASGDRVAMLKTIKSPTLVIHGTDDPLVPIDCGRDTARLIPDAVLREISGMGHDLPGPLIPSLVEMIASHCMAGQPESQQSR